MTRYKTQSNHPHTVSRQEITFIVQLIALECYRFKFIAYKIERNGLWCKQEVSFTLTTMTMTGST